MTARTLTLAALTLSALCNAAIAQQIAHAPHDLALGNPAAIVDLDSKDGQALTKSTWQFTSSQIVDAQNNAVGADLRASGAPVATRDLAPRLGTPAFEKAAWEPIAPGELEKRRGNGKLSFGWYRTSVTIPETFGAVPARGATIVFEIVIDDYAEVWVDGRLPLVLGQSGGALIKGFNAPNRVVLTSDAQPGQRFDLAVFAANGPLSAPPTNFLWVRTATLEVHPRAAQQVSFGTVQRVDPALDAIVPAGARIEKLAEGFQFLEGPVWHPDGYLLFSDPNANTIYRYDPEGRVSVFRAKSGYKGLDVGTYHQPGSNGLTLDKEGRLVIDEHGNRRVTRLERTGALTVLADRYEGKRLNSPNDLVLKSDGTLYFTDPPFGLPKVFDDPKKELPFSGVFCLRDGKLTLLSKELTGPNGIGFSPDEKFLYVSNWDPQRKVILRFPVEAGCAVGAPTVFADLTQAPGEEALDGLKIDARGDVFVSGPGGLWIFDATGKHLGTLHPEQQPANLAWGDDGRTLYLAARTALYRIRLSVSGVTATASR